MESKKSFLLWSWSSLSFYGNAWVRRGIYAQHILNQIILLKTLLLFTTMEFTSTDGPLRYIVSFGYEFSLRVERNGQTVALVTMPISVWHDIEHGRNFYRSAELDNIPISENQLGYFHDTRPVSFNVGDPHPFIEGSRENPIELDEDMENHPPSPQRTPLTDLTDLLNI